MNTIYFIVAAVIPLSANAQVQGASSDIASCLRKNYLSMSIGITAKEAKWTSDERASMGPTRDQDSVGSCYAYAATDMYEHYLKKNGMIATSKKKENVLSSLAVDIQVQSNEIQEKIKSTRDYVQTNSYSIQVTLGEIEKIKKRIAAGVEVEKNLKDLKTNEDWLLQLKKDSPVFVDGNLKVEVKYGEGGQTAQALDILRKNYCLESEVASRDQGLRKKIETKNLASTSTMPKNFKEILALLLGNGDPKDNLDRCLDLSLIKDVFPGFTNTDLARVQQLMKRDENARLNPLLALLEAACPQKNTTMPETVHFIVEDPSYPVKGNDALFETLDQLLDAKGTAVVNLHAAIFGDYAGTPRNDDWHSVSIVGAGTVCGRPHYILRNSWGAGACQRAREDFVTTGTDANTRAPFGCDADGNFIIEKSALKRGAYEVTGFKS